MEYTTFKNENGHYKVRDLTEKICYKDTSIGTEYEKKYIDETKQYEYLKCPTECNTCNEESVNNNNLYITCVINVFKKCSIIITVGGNSYYICKSYEKEQKEEREENEQILEFKEIEEKEEREEDEEEEIKIENKEIVCDESCDTCLVESKSRNHKIIT